MRRIVEKSLSAAAVAAGALFAVWVAGPALGSGPVDRLALEARPLPLDGSDPARDRVGRLKFLGAVQLRSADARFGGLSAMLWEPACNRLLAVSDTGNWVALAPQEQEGRLVGIEAAFMAPVRDTQGRPPLSKRAADAEGLARTGAGATWLFYEQDHRAERFAAISACRPESLAGAPAERWTPPEMRDWPGNGGAEAAAAIGPSLRILAEGVPAEGAPGARLSLDGAPGARPSLDGAPGARLGLAGQPGAALVRFDWPAPEGFQPTAMDPLDPGGSRMLVLQRRFSPLTGVAALLVEADLGGAAPAPAPKEVALLRPPLLVDNMEALAVRVEGERRFVYLLSDDNFNPLQRTILMKFELLPDSAP